MEIDGTKIIEPLGPELAEYVTKLLRSKIGKVKPIDTYLGANVYHLGDNQIGYVVLEEDGEVIYFVRYRMIKHNGLQLGRQVLVWREKESFASRGFAKKIFFDFLLAKFKALVADQEQTKDGRAFWQYALGEAFTRNLYVYFLDRRSSPNKLIALTDIADAKKYEPQMWGTTEGHKRTFAVISKIPLKLRTK